MRSRLRRLRVIEYAGSPTERQCKRIVELEHKIWKAEKAVLLKYL